MMETNKSKGGRPRDTFADPYVVTGKDKDDKPIKTCIFCGHQFSNKTSVTRIKAHLGKLKKQDVICCTKVPFDVEEAARNSMPSSSSKRSNANIPNNNGLQQPSPQDTLQENNVNPTCLNVQSNSPGIGTLRPEDLLQEDTQQLPPQRHCASGPPPPQNMLLDGSRQPTHINSTYWDGQSDSFDMGMLEDLESQEIFQSFYADFSSQIESCSTHGTLASPHPKKKHLGEDHNRFFDQDMLQDAARIDSAHNATTPQNFLQDGGACLDSLAHSAHLEDIRTAEFKNHEGLESSQHDIRENLQGDQRISSLDHDPYPSIVPQLYHMHIDPMLESMDSPKSSPDQAKHEKKRKVLDQRPIGKKLPLRTIFQGPTFKNKVDEISKSLEDDSVSRIGVYGMGGSGKTTIMKFIHNLLLEGCFMPSSHVIWVTVSQDCTISQLQHHLASLLKVELSSDEDEVAWAASLYGKMRKMRYALVLDDVWDKINLEEVGIPEPSRDNGCKLILTTRLLDVCRRMQCEPIFLDLLSKEEAWELFAKTLDVDPEKSRIPDIMKEVSKECACLPLAILTIAGSMRGILNVHEWRDALDSLRNRTHGFTNMKDQVLETLKFSYYRLSGQLQKCLLTCALYPEYTKIEEGDLIVMLLMEGTSGSKESLKSAIDHAKTILNKLENACLLTRVFDNGFVIHDLIRNMCLDIMGDRFLVKCHSKSPPDLSEYKEVVEKVSLIGSGFEKIPSNMMPYCPKLSTLLLSMNENLTSIPDSFFMSFPKLEFLDLSSTSIEELPSSVTNLVSLNALVLCGCTKLRWLPCLTPLKALKLLNLYASRIEEAPEGLEKLVNLTYLNLDKTNIQTVSSLVLTDLVKLQALVLPDQVKIMMQGVKEFKNLDVFEAEFANWEEFSEYVRSMLNSGWAPSFYKIKAELPCAGASCASLLYKNSKKLEKGRIKAELRLREDHEVMGQIPSPEIVQELCIYRSGSNLHQGKIGENGGLKGLFDATFLPVFVNLVDLYVHDLDYTKHLISVSSSVVESSTSPRVLPCFQNLQLLKIEYWESLESMISSANPTKKEESNNPISFPNLRDLTLHTLLNLRSICDGTLICPSIESIRVTDCPKLKRLPLQLQVLDNDNNNDSWQLSSSSPQVLPCFQNLQVLMIFNCESIESILISTANPTEKEESNNPISFPYLRELTLHRLPNLRSVCGGTLICPSIEYIMVYECPRLKRLPLQLPPVLDNDNNSGQLSPPLSSLQAIWGDLKWWESLEWDQQHAKALLQPYFQRLYSSSEEGDWEVDSSSSLI